MALTAFERLEQFRMMRGSSLVCFEMLSRPFCLGRYEDFVARLASFEFIQLANQYKFGRTLRELF